MSVIKEASITIVNFLSKKAATSRVHIAGLLLALASLGPASAHPIPLDEDSTATDAALDFRQARHIDVSSIHSSIERDADEEALQSCRSFKMSER